MAAWTSTFLLLAFCWTLVHAMAHMKRVERAVNNPRGDDVDISGESSQRKRQAAVSKQSSNVPFCNTTDCYNAANELMEYMNISADPCVDFAEYTCGKFYQSVSIPEDENIVHVSLSLDKKNQRVIKEKLEQPVLRSDEKVIKKVKQFYKMCMNISQIKTDGLKIYQQSQEIMRWPTIHDQRTDNLDLTDLVEKYEREFTQGLFGYIMGIDLKNSSASIFDVKQAQFGIDAETLKESARNHTSIMAYQDYYAKIAVHLGANSTIASNDAEELINFEIKLAKLTITTAEEYSNQTAQNNPMTLSEMSQRFPYLDWVRVVKAIYSSIPEISITGNQIVNAFHPKYLEGLGAVLNDTDERVIMNRMAFRYAMMVIAEATPDMQTYLFEMHKVTKGQQKQKLRPKVCMDTTISYFKMVISKLFVEYGFNKKTKQEVKIMVSNLRKSFKDILSSNNWMGTESKQAAIKKLEHLKQLVAYPETGFSYQELDELYKKYVVQNTFYETMIQFKKEDKLKKLRLLNGPVVDSGSLLIPIKAIAAYAPQLHTMILPAGYMQPTMYSTNYPSSLNYGAYGSLVAHEIIHGFDSEGRIYDEKGNLRNWWNSNDTKEYDNRAKCLADHYSTLIIKQISVKENGTRSLTENIADVEGVKIAFKAYKDVCTTENELPLPNLGLTLDQQFYVAFARQSCVKMRDAIRRQWSKSHPYASFPNRIIGPLQMDKNFAIAFKCKPGDPMNPRKKKCSLW